MSLVTNLIKIRFSELGYLPDTPYHLISDEEMCEAFLSSDPSNNISYFRDYYPCVDEALQDEYNALVLAIQYHLEVFKSESSDVRKLPNWVYSYMIGSTIGPKSDPLDIHDLIVPLGCDNLDDEFDGLCAAKCYQASKAWLMKTKKRYVELDDGTTIDTRPPTIFGEPHVVKYVKLQELKV